MDRGAEGGTMRSAKQAVLAAAAGSLLLLMAGAAAAQQPAPGEAPQRTTATYANWVLACETQPGPPPQKTCEVMQVVQAQAQGRTSPFSRVMVPRPAKGQPTKLIVQVPTNITMSTNVRIQLTDNEPGITAPFARCAPVGCFVDFEIKDDVLRKFRAATGNGKITYADASGHEVNVPISFSGFSQALDALAKE